MSIKDKIKKLKEQKLDIEIEIDELISSCGHKDMVSDYGTGECPECGYRTEGWYCETSPTKECNYYNEEEDEYDEDCCIYCGHPEERK